MPADAQIAPDVGDMADAFVASDLLSAESWPHAALKAVALGVPLDSLLAAAVYSARSFKKPYSILLDGLRNCHVGVEGMEGWAKAMSWIWGAFGRGADTPSHLAWEIHSRLGRDFSQAQLRNYSLYDGAKELASDRRTFGTLVARRCPEGAALFYKRNADRVAREDAAFADAFAGFLARKAEACPEYQKLAWALAADVKRRRSTMRFLS